MPINNRVSVTVTDDSQKPFDDVESTGSVANNNASRGDTKESTEFSTGRTITTEEIKTLKHIKYVPEQDQIVSDRAIETTLNSLFLGGQHKMSSGAENIFFTNLGNDTNFYPMWGGLKDQSLTANQGSSGFIPPSGRVYTDMFSLPLGGNADNTQSIGYSGDNYFGVNIAGLGITTTSAETIDQSLVRLEYRLFINSRQVYKQVLPDAIVRSASFIYPNDVIEWFFDHPVEIHAGTTIFAEIHKVRKEDDVDLGVFQVRQGDAIQADGNYRYQAIVHNRLFEDKDIELISPYLKYKAMDFGLDSTGSTVFLRDLSLGSESLLVPHAVNTLEAIADGTEIKIKIKNGAKILVESLPVNAVSINGSFVNSVLNQAVLQLNAIFTNTAGFASDDTFVNSFVLSGNDLTLGLNDSTSYTVDITTLGVDENKFVSSGSLSGSELTLTMTDSSVVTVDVTGLSLDENTTVSSGVVSGTDIILTMSDSSTVTVDASTLGGSSSSGNPVASGSVVGTDLVLVLDDATRITIDATNMINGSATFASGADWYYSYGDRANSSVNNTISDLTLGIASRAPFYFGTELSRGTEFQWNFNNNKAFVLGVWDGAEANAGTFNSRQQTNWSTGFWRDTSGFRNGSNTTLTTTNNGANNRYIPSFGANLALRFLNNGHVVLVDLSGTSEVEIAKTNNALVVSSFQLQLGCDSQFVLPQFVASDSNNIWDIVHDLDNSQSGLFGGIEKDTVIKSGISIGIGEKLMFMLDEDGRAVMFGTAYSGGNSSGVTDARNNLTNTFMYQTNEALVFTVGGANDWIMSTGASGYFFSANLDQYRNGGGSGTIQGMFSLRFNNDGKLTIYDEDAGHKVATAKVNPTVGGLVHLYLGYKDNLTAYGDIPTISKQSLSQSNQPDANYIPVIADQTTTVEEAQVLNFQVISSDNIVNQFVEVDAPSWLTMNQNSGVLSGTAPAFLGTSADTIVVTCKGGNAIGGTIDFTVTISVTEDTSYSNSKSLSFNGTSTFLQGNATLMDSMDRATNGDGNAWSVSMWVKPNNNTSAQTLFVYGSGSASTEGAIVVKKVNANNITITYGTYSSANIGVFGNAFTANTWSHVLVTFDGGTTGDAGTNLSDYYSRFNVYVNGVLASTIGLNSNNGYTGSISGENTSDNIFRLGRNNNVHNEYYDGLMNQVGIWSSDESSNASTIYNSGSAQDLSLLSSAPDHYYEVESSVTTITDSTGSANLTGYNFVASDLVTDTP